jgi:glutamine amidotransferase
MTVTIIDYGIGNIRSVQKALEFVGATVALTTCADDILTADKLLLPGVGAFGAAMDALRARGWVEPIQQAAGNGTPLLGICLGMQLLLDESDEMGQHAGLGLINGRVTRFPPSLPLKVPHMGWNAIHHQSDHPLLHDVDSGDYAYFVHSYYCIPADPAYTLATVDYGMELTAVMGKDNIFGAQFHPEKSQKAGLQILKNFAGMGQIAGE